VATLMVALLVTTDNLAGTAERTRTFSNLKIRSGKRTFAEAVAGILAMDKLPREVWLQVSIRRQLATITTSAPGGFDKSEFTIDGKAPPRGAGLHVDVSLFEGLHQIANTIGGKE
jgi:hypothetical protein